MWDLNENQKEPWGADAVDIHMKGVGMLVALLRGVNFGFCSHLREKGKEFHTKKYKNICLICFKCGLFRGSKTVFWGLIQNFQQAPPPFHM